MREDHIEDLRAYQKRLVQDEFARGAYQEVLAALTTLDSKEDRRIAAVSHYELMKRDSAIGDLISARQHGAEVERLAGEDRGIRALATERLRLLSRKPRGVSVPLAFNPGVILIGGLGGIVVLGKYHARGAMDGLTEAILLLKKAPEEMDEAQSRARPDLIDRLGLMMSDALARSQVLDSVDLIVPIPPDPDRYSARLYHPPEAVGKAIAKYSTIPCIADVLVKLRSTRDLRGISGPTDRALEIEGSMEANEARIHLVEGRVMLLIDDVVTYGTHFREAKNVLTDAGAAAVYASALATAHGQPEPRPR